MNNIADSINELIIKTYGGLVAFWCAIAYVVGKLFFFLGGCMLEGGINKGIIKIIPILKKEFKNEFDKIDELGGKVDCLEDYLKTSLKNYKQEKHGIENENILFKDAILTKNFKTQEEIRKFYEKKDN